MSSLSGTDRATSRRRYRRDDRERREADEIVAEKRTEARAPPAMAPLDPPNPAFAVGRNLRIQRTIAGGLAQWAVQGLVGVDM